MSNSRQLLPKETGQFGYLSKAPQGWIHGRTEASICPSPKGSLCSALWSAWWCVGWGRMSRRGVRAQWASACLQCALPEQELLLCWMVCSVRLCSVSEVFMQTGQYLFLPSWITSSGGTSLLGFLLLVCRVLWVEALGWRRPSHILCFLLAHLLSPCLSELLMMFLGLSP